MPADHPVERAARVSVAQHHGEAEEQRGLRREAAAALAAAVDEDTASRPRPRRDHPFTTTLTPSFAIGLLMRAAEAKRERVRPS